MVDRSGIFKGDDPFRIAQSWLDAAGENEPNDPNACALATVDASGLPNVRMVLLKSIEADGFVFFTNYDSRKGQEIIANGKAALNLHWKSLRRQIRVRGIAQKTDTDVSDNYFASRPLGSRIGAWASKQSQPLPDKAALIKAVAVATAKHGKNPKRPENWGGFIITPTEIEFWADGAFRLHDRFRWSRKLTNEIWKIQRLNP